MARFVPRFACWVVVFTVLVAVIGCSKKSDGAPPDVKAAPADATKTKSGLATRVIKAGSGARPAPWDSVVVHYTGWKPDGTLFDTTRTGAPVTLRFSEMSEGLAEGLMLMTPGEQRRLWIPAALGETRASASPPAGDVVIDAELIEVKVALKPIAPPPDVAAPPADAKRTPSGLAYEVLTPGKGTVHARRDQKVRIDYSGWTTDGRMFDSSVSRGTPLVMAPQEMAAGSAEAILLMTEGEKSRFWIPANLAYGDKPAKRTLPAGMIVFDYELLAIVP